MKKITLKFNVTAKRNGNGSMTVTGSPIEAECEENKQLTSLTPVGGLHLEIAKGAPAQAIFEGMNNNTECTLEITRPD